MLVVPEVPTVFMAGPAFTGPILPSRAGLAQPAVSDHFVNQRGKRSCVSSQNRHRLRHPDPLKMEHAKLTKYGINRQNRSAPGVPPYVH